MRTKQLFAALDRVDRECEEGPARILTKMLRSAVATYHPEEDGWGETEDRLLGELLFERQITALDRDECGNGRDGREHLIHRLAFCLEIGLSGDDDTALREHLEDAHKLIPALVEAAE